MTLDDLLKRLRAVRLLVVGDVMLDSYLMGGVHRISPEAPVPVVDVQSEVHRLGGAANVALNLKALGAEAVLCGCIGQDAAGEQFLTCMAEADLTTDALFTAPQRRTTTKIRVIGNRQQILRIDREDAQHLTAEEAAMRRKFVTGVLSGLAFDGVIFEDYDKGWLDAAFIAELTALAGATPIFVDPKFRQFRAYAGCTLFKPNLKELNQALQLNLAPDDHEGIVAAVRALRSEMPHRHTMITLSEHGLLFVDETYRATHIAGHTRRVSDVSGAGDTVIGVYAAGVAAGLDPLTAARAANLAGGLVCEEVGVVPINRERLAHELKTNGILA